jgi:CRISPR-associated Csx2 family protein
MPKIFISFLGTADYRPANYFVNGDKTKTMDNVRFVQEALLYHFEADWQLTAADKVLVFVTPEAKNLNWLDAEHTNWQTKEKNAREGLKSRLEKLNLKAQVLPVDIENGKSETEIWGIFDKVFQNLGEGDEVYFDITFGFRSLPMLAMVLIDFAKFLKDIKLRGIYYGAVEAQEDGKTPIWNLNSFANLQSWTSAADIFVNYGKADGIAQLVDNQQFQKAIEVVTGNFATARGLNILQGQDFEVIKRQIETLDNDPQTVKPLKEILKKIRAKVAAFESLQSTNPLPKVINNTFLSIEWCLDHDLTQQGLTLLQEGIFTIVLVWFGKDYRLYNPNRKVVSSCFNVCKMPRHKWRFDNPEQWNLAETLLNPPNNIFRIFANHSFVFEGKTYKGLMQTIGKIRNDINHAGYGENPIEASKLSPFVQKLFEETRKIVAQHIN